MQKLSGKTALVTGASRGIGRAIALRLAAEGASVAVNYNGSEAKAAEVVEQIRAAGGTAFAVQANVADASSVAAMFETVLKEFGNLDILVNNAGITSDGLLIGMNMPPMREPNVTHGTMMSSLLSILSKALPLPLLRSSC